MITREDFPSPESIFAQLFLSGEVCGLKVGIISRINEVDQVDEFSINKLDR
jgi:hypothetical protein